MFQLFNWVRLVFFSFAVTESESSQKKMKRKLGDSGARVDSEEEKKTKKQKGSQRPNYFVSIPITNAQVSVWTEADIPIYTDME
jgi:hypothetical protein